MQLPAEQLSRTLHGEYAAHSGHHQAALPECAIRQTAMEVGDSSARVAILLAATAVQQGGASIDI